MVDNNLLNLKTYDPFAEAEENENQLKYEIHLRIQARNGRKCITIVQGLDGLTELKPFVKKCKKSFNCNGSITKDEEFGNILQFSGDQRENIKKILIGKIQLSKENIIIHGY